MADIYGDESANNLIGGPGNDQLYGLGGNDTLTGDAGDDILDGGDGDDFLQGDLNENNISVTGNDVMVGGNGNDQLRGGLGNDQFYGGANNDQFRGNGGIDYFDGGIDDGEGVNGIGDRVSFFEQRATQGVVADLRTGVISNDGFGNVETMVGIESLGGDSAFIDTFYGNDDRNYLAGGRGDSVYAFGGDDRFQMISATALLDGGDGIDHLSLFVTGNGQLLPDSNGDGLAEFAPAATAGWSVNLAAGTILDGYGYSGTVTGVENVNGSILADTLIGDANANVLNGGDGDDLIEGRGGDDTLDGGLGIDTASYANAAGNVTVNLGSGTASGADGNDTLVGFENVIGSAYNDALTGNASANVLTGGDGGDTLRGGGGNDSLLGGSGNDFHNGGFGDDMIDGGVGFDRAAYFQASAAIGGVTVSLLLQNSWQNTGSQGLDYLTGIENLSGTPFADSLTGDSGNNWLWGSVATIDVGFASTTNNDMLDGGDGNDMLWVGIGNHNVIGGAGIDTLYFTENGQLPVEGGVTVSLGLQGAVQTTGQGNWTLTGIENLSGGTGDDNLTGDGNANVLGGSLGADSLSGAGGDDILLGDGFIDFDASNVTINVLDLGVDGGNDLLEGGLGNDQLYGGAGIDTASYTNAAGGVTVTLFTNGNGNGSSSGADGNDTLSGIENLTGSAFNDILGGNNQDNVLTGGAGNDTLRGNAGNDQMFGGSGNDFLGNGAGDDLIDGGDGFDRVSHYTGAIAGVTVDLRIQGVAQNTGQGNDTLVGIEHVSGTIFGDVLTGNDGDNWIWGSPATLADATISAANNDVLDGQGGNDLLVVGIGNHSIDGGTGTDTLAFTENANNDPAVSVSLALQGAAQVTGQGNWTITNIENLSGGTNNDTLTGDGNANILGGYIGNDTLVGGAGNDQLFGDGFIGADTRPTLGSGPITLFTTATQYDPALIDGNDTLEGGLGDDLINGGGGIDTASYANASGAVTANLFLNGNGNGSSSGADGNDTLSGIENITGSAFNDALTGNSLANVLTGGDGNDSLRGRGGDDSLLGGGGNDFLNGGLGDDVIDGGAGFDRAAYFTDAIAGVTVDLRIQGVAQNTGQGMDTLTGIEHVSGTSFADVLTGDDGDNWIWASPATLGDGSISAANNDVLDGQGGNDLLVVGIGNHSIDGGTGTDTLAFTENASTDPAVAISLAMQGAAQVTGQGSWTITNIENLSGGTGNDALTGDGNVNILAGFTGNDSLVGGAGNDQLYGDGFIATDNRPTGGSGPIGLFTDAALFDPFYVDGNDTLEGGLGDDLINGGGGIDTASYANAGGGVNVNLGNGTASGADGNDTLTSIENAIGSAFNDSITGSGGGNVLDGLGGNDGISGGAGDDIIYGGDGNDTLRGDFGDANITATGNDVIYGGNGNDFLGGGLGDDLLYGGTGNDLFRGNGGVDYFDGGPDDGLGNGFGDRISFYDVRATQGVVADLRTGIISNDGFGNVETMVNIESLGSNTAFADTFYGNDGQNYLAGDRNDTVYGFGGDDFFQLTSAAAMLDGGTGVDIASLYSSGGWLLPDSNGDGLAEVAAAASSGWNVNLTAGTMVDGHGNSGTIAGVENVDGSELGDTLIGDANANVLNGGDGDDLIEGRGGNDTLDGGIGIDTASYANASGAVTVTLTATGGTASGADGSDTLTSIENVTGGGFNDVLSGNANANLLIGGDGHDRLSGGDGNDVIQAGSGDDSLSGGAGDDLLDGGSGFDRANYNVGATAGVTVNLTLQGAAQNTIGAGLDTLIGIDHVVGTIFNDVLTGDAGDNWLWGGSLGTGVTGNDTISGGDGNDLIEVGTGTHSLNGGNGVDTLTFFGGGTDITAAGVTFSLASAAAQNSEQGMVTATLFENLSGSIHDDVFTGSVGNNVLAGNAGADQLSGGDGNDVLYGDGGFTTFTAGGAATGPIRLVRDVAVEFGAVAGNDILNGGKGDDILYGGRGNDVMSGGPGADRFIIEAQSGADRITDFAHVDRIVFEASSGASAFSQLVFTAVGRDTRITWGTADSLTVEGYRPRDLTAADFVFTPAPVALFSTEQSRTSAAANSNQMLIGTVAAAGMAFLTIEPTSLLASDLAIASGGGVASTNMFVGQLDGLDMATIDTSRSALGSEWREAAMVSASTGTNGWTSPLALSGNFDAALAASEPLLSGFAMAADVPDFGQFAATTGMATGIAIPAAETLLAGMAGGGSPVSDVALQDLASLLDGNVGAPDIDSLLAALPGNDGAAAGLAMALESIDQLASLQWSANVAVFDVASVALHPDTMVTG